MNIHGHVFNPSMTRMMAPVLFGYALYEGAYLDGSTQWLGQMYGNAPTAKIAYRWVLTGDEEGIVRLIVPGEGTTH